MIDHQKKKGAAEALKLITPHVGVLLVNLITDYISDLEKSVRYAHKELEKAKENDTTQ